MSRNIAKLPSLNHTNLHDWDNVYEPSEDTFLLCDALLMEINDIIEAKPLISAEIGCGSGCVITYLSMLLDSNGCGGIYFCSDINPFATRLASRTAAANNIDLNVVQCRFLDGLGHLKNNVDILLFNPPYVPTPNEEVDDGFLRLDSDNNQIIAASWAGGDNGRIVIDRFLPLIQTLLSPSGRCYIVLVSDNNPKQISLILDSFGLTSMIVLKRRAKNEELMIMKITKP